MIERFKLNVQQYDVIAPYRPEALRNHALVKQHYLNIPGPHVTCWQTLSSAFERRRAWAAKWLNAWASAVIVETVSRGLEWRSGYEVQEDDHTR